MVLNSDLILYPKKFEICGRGKKAAEIRDVCLIVIDKTLSSILVTRSRLYNVGATGTGRKTMFSDSGFTISLNCVMQKNIMF